MTGTFTRFTSRPHSPPGNGSCRPVGPPIAPRGSRGVVPLDYQERPGNHAVSVNSWLLAMSLKVTLDKVPIIKKNGTAECIVCVNGVRTFGGQAYTRFTHHGLVHHLRLSHLDWTMERVKREAPEFYARLRAACDGCTQATHAREARMKKHPRRGSKRHTVNVDRAALDERGERLYDALAAAEERGESAMKRRLIRDRLRAHAREIGALT